MLAEACRMQAEGIVSKRSDGAYTSGRTKSWIKIKCVRRQEFVIGVSPSREWNRRHRRPSVAITKQRN